MAQPHRITLLGAGLIGNFYATALQRPRSTERIDVVYSRSPERAEAFAQRWSVSRPSSDLRSAITDAGTDVVVVALPNDLHEEAVRLAAEAGKAVLCTKPLGRSAAEAQRMTEAVHKTGVFAGYLEDLCYTPKTSSALASVQTGAVGDVLWVRSRESHPGPHSAWFWDSARAGGGAVVDLGCHCIEIIRNFIGKGVRPVEVMCWMDTLVHPIDVEDHAVALIRFENGALGQFEVSWGFRGGMDLRDEVSGTGGTIWLNHFLRTGFEMFVAEGQSGYVAEKAETGSGWLFPVGDEAAELGYTGMFDDMFESLDAGRKPRETFEDGYIVNAVIDACYESAQSRAWADVGLAWAGGSAQRIRPRSVDGHEHAVVKEEILPDGRTKQIIRNTQTGKIEERLIKTD